MSDELIVFGSLGAGAVVLLCSTIGFLGYQLAKTMETVLKFNHKEDRDHRAMLERFLELVRTPTHLTGDIANLHAMERNNQVVAETKTEVVHRDPVPEVRVPVPSMFTTDPDIRGHFN